MQSLKAGASTASKMMGNFATSKGPFVLFFTFSPPHSHLPVPWLRVAEAMIKHSFPLKCRNDDDLTFTHLTTSSSRSKRFGNVFVLSFFP